MVAEGDGDADDDVNRCVLVELIVRWWDEDGLDTVTMRSSPEPLN